MSVSGLTDIRRFIILYFNQLSICLPGYIILQHETRLTVTLRFVESDFVVLAFVTTTELLLLLVPCIVTVSKSENNQTGGS